MGVGVLGCGPRRRAESVPANTEIVPAILFFCSGQALAASDRLAEVASVTMRTCELNDRRVVVGVHFFGPTVPTWWPFLTMNSLTLPTQKCITRWIGECFRHQRSHSSSAPLVKAARR
jgi:hypothetical protein